MKKTILTAFLTLSLALGINISANADQKIASIDIQKIVDNSAEIQELNKEQEAKIQELEKWVDVVKADIELQKTDAGKEKLFKKYRASYVKKKADILKSGQVKMEAIMKNISETIKAQAQEKGYDVIITKGVVIYGADDITEDVQKALNEKK